MDDLFPYYKPEEWANCTGDYICGRHYKYGTEIPATKERIKNEYDGLCFPCLCNICFERFMNVDVQTKLRDARMEEFRLFLEEEDRNECK